MVSHNEPHLSQHFCALFAAMARFGLRDVIAAFAAPRVVAGLILAREAREPIRTIRQDQVKAPDEPNFHGDVVANELPLCCCC